MKILTEKEYTQLKENGVDLVGRVCFHHLKNETIYFQIDEDQKRFSATEILDTLALVDLRIKPNERYDVIRHWSPEELKIIDY